MADFSNIPTGLKITTQIPLNVKEFCKDEDTLAYLGVDDNLAFTYHDQLEVLCLAEKSIYIWREVQEGEENTGLVPLDFTYPTGLSNVYDINYSGKKYNFFLKTENLTIIENVGTGAEIYKGDDLLGRKELRTVTKTGNLVTVTENINDIAISINEVILDGFIKDNQETYSAANVGTGAAVYKDTTTIGNNQQFNFKKIKSTKNTVNIIEDTNEVNLEVENLQKSISTFPYTLTSADDKYTIFINNGVSDVIINVPNGLMSNFSCVFIQEGSGVVTIQQSGTATLLYPSVILQNKIRGQYYWAMVEKKTTTDTYYLLGSLLPV